MLKVDTKEKFVVVRLTDGVFSVNVSEALTIFVRQQLQEVQKSVVVDFENVQSAEKQALVDLASNHEIAYTKNASFVICNLNDAIKKELDELELLDVLNITPTESEAWDIVQMEEMEREFFGGEDI